MPVFKNDGLEVLAFMLDVEQDIIRQIGICLNDEERQRAQGLGLEQDRRRFVAARGHCAGSSVANLEFRRPTSNSSMGGWATPSSRTVCPRAICTSAFHDPQMWRS